MYTVAHGRDLVTLTGSASVSMSMFPLNCYMRHWIDSVGYSSEHYLVTQMISRGHCVVYVGLCTVGLIEH